MTKRIIQILLALAAIAAAIIGANYWRNNYLSGVTMVNIPVPVTNIPAYTTLSADMFVMKEFPRALADLKGSDAANLYVLSTADLEGSISVETLLEGIPVARRMAVPPDQFRLADPSLEVVSLPVEASNGVGGQIRIGETINVYIMQPAAQQDQETTTNTPKKPEVILIAHVPVVAVLADNGQPLSSGDSSGEPKPMKILVIAAPPETVHSILDAIAMTKLEGSLLWVTLATP